MSTKNPDIISPLFKDIDKIIFGIEEFKESATPSEFIECDTEEEFDVQRSIN